jgi:Sec7-like guanine-nucleotide exchange factor
LRAHLSVVGEEFVSNNRGINDGKDLPVEYLTHLYEGIKAKQIQLDADILDANNHAAVDITDLSAWNSLLSKGSSQTPALFTSTTAARMSGKNEPWAPYVHEKDMFLVISDVVLETLVTTTRIPTDHLIFGRTITGLWDYFKICVHLNMAALSSKAFLALLHTSSYTLHHQELNNYVLTSTIKGPSPSSTSSALVQQASDPLQAETTYLETILLTDMEQVLASQKHIAEDLKFDRFLLIKGELLAKLIYEVFSSLIPVLDMQAIKAFLYFLLWFRARG